MLNQFILIGRISSDLEKKELKNNRKCVVKLKLSIPRSYKNNKGLYDTDVIECKLSGDMAKTCYNYYKKGDIVGVKGMLESKGNKINVIANKITFLSSKKEA